MGVRWSPRVGALLVLGAVLASSMGCRNRSDGTQTGGISGLTSDGPNGKLDPKSSSPGLEPPVVGPGSGAAGMTSNPVMSAGSGGQTGAPGMMGMGTAGGNAAGSGAPDFGNNPSAGAGGSSPPGSAGAAGM